MKESEKEKILHIMKNVAQKHNGIHQLLEGISDDVDKLWDLISEKEENQER